MKINHLITKIINKRLWIEKFKIYYKNFIKLFSYNVWKNTLNALNNNTIVVYWWRGRGDKNWGDKINKYLISELSGKVVLHVDDIFNLRFIPVYASVGSIIHNLKYHNISIWGSGLIDGKIPNKVKLKEIYAVRGPKTRSVLIKKGLNCPKVFGDPVLLLPKLYNPKIGKQHRIGIVPHYSDKNNKHVEHLVDQGAYFIDIYGDELEVVDNIIKCDNILSSSLHGLILADAYQIPSKWIEINPLIGNYFKFQDYYNSIEIFNEEAVKLEEGLDISQLIDRCKRKEINVDLDKLLNSCPFLNNKSIKNP